MGPCSSTMTAALVVGLLVVNASVLAMGKTQSSTPGQPFIPQDLQDSDFVLAIGTSVKRLPVAQASRSWRGNIRTLIAIEDAELAKSLHQQFSVEHGEHYAYWPDRSTGKLPGDSRVVLVPWLAHAKWKGTYKWLLYGDDDTLWFMPAIMQELRDYDYRLPYVVTDNYASRAYNAPRCLPCHKRDLLASLPEATRTKLANRPLPYAGCPCTPQLARQFERAAAAYYRLEVTPYWSHTRRLTGFTGALVFIGGAGALMSAEAIDKISWEQVLECTYDNPKTLTFDPSSLKSQANGDKLISYCLFKHGIGLTDPGYLPLYGEHHRIHNGRFPSYNQTVAGVVRGHISQHLEEYWHYQRVISSHVSARKLAKAMPHGYKDVAAFMQERYTEYLQAYKQIDAAITAKKRDT